mgnify:FL=1|tara:strand:- start:138 stop:725 length:588 start_codon:yes stop_codon:yes gene_type:complete
MSEGINITRYPIFPSSVYAIYLKDDVSEFFNSIVGSVNFGTYGADNPHTVSKFTLLDDYPEMKKLFTDVSLQVLSEVAGAKKIKMTTSWLTAIEPDETPVMHRHTNSWFSGVYYFQDSPYTGLEFKNPIERDIDLVTKGSLLNWRLQPKKNMLIIFPSYLHHKIEKNTFDEVRHSLAFNVMPDGATGDVDSKFIY